MDNKNTVYEVDFTRTLPERLKNDPNMLSIGKIISEELRENIRLAEKTIIYARIDELDGEILDILAYDFKVDWYDDTYPIDIKRTLIKESVRVHKRLGTKFAVETALQAVFPGSRVVEWFEYGGEPFRFRIEIDARGAAVIPDVDKIIAEARFYKRLAAHLDGIIFIYNRWREVEHLKWGEVTNMTWRQIREEKLTI